jgi:hypothetical protein
MWCPVWGSNPHPLARRGLKTDVARIIGIRPLPRPPNATHFAIGRLQLDQIESYAERKAITVEAAERLLSTTLAYDPLLSL